MHAIIARFLRDRSGATAVEYALIAGIVCIGIIAGISAVRDGVNVQYNKVSTELSK